MASIATLHPNLPQSLIQTQFHHDDLAEIRNILLDLQRRAIRQEAIMTNARIIKRNQHLRSTTPDAALTAPVKEVCSRVSSLCLTVVTFPLQIAGSGLHLVTVINGVAPAAAIANVNPAHNPIAVGTVHPNFDPTSMTSNDVYKLIVWYNQDYGIFPADSLGARRDKVMHWLTTPIF